jgi:hypothetical protein
MGHARAAQDRIACTWLIARFIEGGLDAYRATDGAIAKK